MRSVARPTGIPSGGDAKRVAPGSCLIGAGSSGIVAAKVLAERGLPFRGYELGSDIGGIWRYRNDSGRSPAYRSLRTNTSDARTAYRSFPLDGPPRHMGHAELLEYLESFAAAFGVRERFRFRHEVTAVEPDAAGYRVTARAVGGGPSRSAPYDAVVVATGHHWDASLPDWAADFEGTLFHSRDYRTPTVPEPLAGRRVLVVGIGNSACDIACEVAGVAARAVLSTRTGAHVLPKLLFGRPIDTWVTPLSSRLPVRAQAALLDALVRLDRGDQRRFGIPRPDRPLGHEHPTLSQELPPLVRAGKLAVAGDVERVTGRRIRFRDGLEESFDAVICATGYHIAFPFLSEGLLDRLDPRGAGSRQGGRIAGNRIRLYRHVVPPGLPGLYFLGLVQPLGAIPPLAEAQAEWIADLLDGTGALPSEEEMEASIAATERELAARFVRSRRHTLEVDFFPYLRALARERRAGRGRAIGRRALGGRTPVRRTPVRRTAPPGRALLVGLAALATAACGPADSAGRGGEDSLPLTLDNIFRRAGGARSAAVSSDGEWVAVTGRSTEGSGIHLVPTGPGAGEAAALRVAGGSPVWSPDGTSIAFTGGGGLSVLARGSDDARRIVEDMEGVRSPAFSPDGATLAFYATDSGFQDVWLVPADGSDAPRRLTRGAAEADDGRFAPAWSPDGEWIAFISNRADWWHDDVWAIEVATGRTAKLSSDLMAASSPVWSPDGSSLVLMGTAKDEYWYEDLAYLYRIDLDFSSGVPRTVRETPIEMQVWASDFIMRFDPYWSGDGERIYFPYHERGAFDLWTVPASGGVATRVTNVGGVWSSLDATPDGSRAVFTRDAPLEGSESWLVDAAGGPPRRLTDFSPDFRDLQRPTEISFRSFDGLYIQGFLYLPPALRGATEAAPATPGAWPGPACPALVQVHGGGTNSYYQGTNLVEQYLASRGFVVLAVNYRGGSGFGRAFQDLSVEDWLNDQSRDPGAASDWLRAQPWVNGEVGIYGGSYGGMQSMSAITRTPDKFDAAVPMRGIYSESLTLPYADRLGKIFTITGHGGTPEERPEIYAKSETLDRMDAITAPVLIMHGERDVRAPFENFELAVERLEALGKEFEAVTYPEGHGFRDPANSIDMYSRLEAFFRRHLGECGTRAG